MKESISAMIVVTLAIALFLCAAVFSHNALQVLSSSDTKTEAPATQVK
jgi:hypothetical protein